MNQLNKQNLTKRFLNEYYFVSIDNCLIFKEEWKRFQINTIIRLIFNTIRNISIDEGILYQPVEAV